MTKKDEILACIEQWMQRTPETSESGVTTQQLAEQLGMQRSNVSTLLGELVADGKLEKLAGRPVHYRLPRSEGTAGEGSCFKALTGCDGTLKPMIRMAKAAILYPEHSLNTLIVGPAGCGKTSFAYLMYQFACENHIIPTDAPFVRLNCSHYEEQEGALERRLLGTGVMSDQPLLQKARGGVLFLDEIGTLSGSDRDCLLEMIDDDGNSMLRDTILICAASDKTRPSLLDALSARFSARVELPALHARQLSERYELVQKFLQEEASRMKKTLSLYAELLHCLCLYRCERNIEQLKGNIRLGCANAYVRTFGSDEQQLDLTLNDFPACVRRGLLYYKANRDALEQLIPQQFAYTFSADSIKRKNSKTFPMPDLGHTPPSETIYDIIERKAAELRGRGIGEEDISRIINAELEYSVKEFSHQIVQSKVSRESLYKIVDRRIVDFVEGFLREASARFHKVYPETTFFGLCLHLASTIERGAASVQRLSNDRILEVVEQYRDEYAFSMNFVAVIEKEFETHLSIDEAVLITLFIGGVNLYHKPEAGPVVLIAMHGDHTASSVADVAGALAQGGNTYAYDMPLDKDMQQVFDELKALVQEIDQGQGILLLYDMGSLRTMAELIEKETNVPIRTVAVPGTLIAVDASRKASACTSLDELQEDVLDSCREFYSQITLPNGRNHTNKELIITLCMTGHGGAVQMKNYLEKHASLHRTDVIPLAISDRKALLAEVNRLRKEYEIRCVIGTYDPELHAIPFISVVQLFETPTDKLDILLSMPQTERQKVNYDMIYTYLGEQVTGLDIKRLRKCLPKAIAGIKRAAQGLSQDQEVGLFLHIACAIDRLQHHEDMPQKFNREGIISHNKRLYNDLRDILKGIEETFGISFSDDEVAYIIGIIKKL